VGRLAIADAGFFHLERASAPLHIAALAIAEGPLDRDALVARVRERLPRLAGHAQRVKRAPLDWRHPAWETPAGLDVAAHVQRWVVPAPGGEPELLELTEQIFAQPLAPDRPLWELHLIEGLEGGRSALLHELHHCAGDGELGVQVLAELLDTEPHAVRRVPEPEASSRADRLRAAGRAAVRRLVGGPRALLDALGPLPALPWNERLQAQRRLACLRLPLGDARRIRRALGTTLNDVVLSVLAGGLARYLVGLGLAPQRLRALVPVSLRTLGATRGANRISAMLVPLAAEIPDELARLAATRDLTQALKRRAAWEGVALLLDGFAALPPAVFARLARSVQLGRFAHLVATNVRGPERAGALLGQRVSAVYPFTPIADGLGLGVAVLSYGGGLCLGINADADRIPEPEKLRRGIEESFEALVRASGGQDRGSGVPARGAR
jgi:WS/DGAT/MGAT family acyltransferase